MNNFFVSGASGLLSINIFFKYYQNFNFTGALHNKILDLGLKNVSLIKIDLFDKSQLIHLLKKTKPNYFFHNAALTNLELCEKNQDLCNKVNYELTKVIVDVCKDLNIKLIFLSSDQLYSGNQDSYKEDDITSPINNYGKTKVLSEEYILKHLPDSIIIRTNFFGWGTSYRKSFSDRILEIQNIHNEVLSDVFFNPVYAGTLIDIIFKLITINFNGIINVSSDEPISKYNLANQLLSGFNIIKTIQPIKLDNLPKYVKRPKKMVLDNSKLINILNLKSININDCIEKLKLDKKSGLANILKNI